MKKFNLFLIGILFFTGCEKFSDNTDELKIMNKLQDKLPGKHVSDMATDSKGNIYFITSEIDTTIKVPIWSSFLPSRFYLSKQTLNQSTFEIIDNQFITGGRIIFDTHDNLWIKSPKAIYKYQNNKAKAFLNLSPDDGLIEFIAVDSKNNIWAGGLQTGLYKIDNELIITKYNINNSKLPSNSMTNIYIDKSDIVWIALWDKMGVLKIENENWTIYNSQNSNIVSQNIWCLTTDKNNDLWIGTGWENSLNSLMKFDGKNWIVINPKDKKGKTISCIVRILYSDKQKIWVACETLNTNGQYTNQLLTYDGLSWVTVDELSGNTGITDFEIDYFRNIAWIATYDKGLIKIGL